MWARHTQMLMEYTNLQLIKTLSRWTKYQNKHLTKCMTPVRPHKLTGLCTTHRKHQELRWVMYARLLKVIRGLLQRHMEGNQFKISWKLHDSICERFSESDVAEAIQRVLNFPEHENLWASIPVSSQCSTLSIWSGLLQSDRVLQTITSHALERSEFSGINKCVR